MRFHGIPVNVRNLILRPQMKYGFQAVHFRVSQKNICSHLVCRNVAISDDTGTKNRGILVYSLQ